MHCIKFFANFNLWSAFNILFKVSWTTLSQNKYHAFGFVTFLCSCIKIELLNFNGMWFELRLSSNFATTLFPSYFLILRNSRLNRKHVLIKRFIKKALIWIIISMGEIEISTILQKTINRYLLKQIRYFKFCRPLKNVLYYLSHTKSVKHALLSISCISLEQHLTTPFLLMKIFAQKNYWLGNTFIVVARDL